MQYQVTCNHCKQLYVVDAAPGVTVRSRCPYCGAVSTIATPCEETEAASTTKPQRPLGNSGKPVSRPAASTESSLTRKVVMLFCAAVFLLIILAAVLYAVFRSMTV